MKRFPSIKKTSDFKEIYSKGKSRATECLVMYVLKKNGCSRIGIAASKKTGNSVVRHKFIRRIREIYRLNSVNTLDGYEVVVVARRPAAKAKYERLEKDYIRLMKQLGIYKDCEGIVRN